MTDWMIFAGALSFLAGAAILARALVHAVHFEKCRGRDTGRPGAARRKH